MNITSEELTKLRSLLLDCEPRDHRHEAWSAVWVITGAWQRQELRTGGDWPGTGPIEKKFQLHDTATYSLFNSDGSLTVATEMPHFSPPTVAMPQFATKEALDALDKRLAQLDADHVALLKAYTHHLHHHTPPPLRDAGKTVVDDGKEYATKTELDALRAEVAALEKARIQMDADHVAFMKCYVYHLREHMPEALRNAGESVTVVDDGEEEYATATDLVDVLAAHVRDRHDPHGLGVATSTCTECAETDCKHEKKPDTCMDFRYKHPR
jgi:hypothetical protein